MQGRAHGVVLLITALSFALSACGLKPVKPPTPLTESAVRARFTAERSEQSLAQVRDAATRETMRRQLGERARSARAQGRRLAIESIRAGEQMTLGQGMRLERVFALYHEYDDKTFTTFLEGVEIVAGTPRVALRQPVGGPGRGFVELSEVELNRAILEVHLFKDGDAKCCPTDIGRTAYYLTGFSLEPAQ